MSRKGQPSQWDFGELFTPEQTRVVLTVGELTAKIRRVLEKEVASVWVSGEVTNLRAQASGHIYFTLKDAAAQLSCVLFRGEAAANREFLQDGQKLLLNGELTVYEVRGQYQMLVRAIEPQGMGALQIAFEKLKRKLQGEGLFETARKRPLPRYPRRLGIVTSPTGAAIRDVLHVIERRAPGLEIILAPSRVQGDGAAKEIAEAIRLLNEWSASLPLAERLDVILVTRGGGSLEDLWAFNEEAVARAIFESEVPVVSAVGHEIDFTISDFVADVRAATPSVAAEIITEGFMASRHFLAESERRLRQVVRLQLELNRDSINELLARLTRLHPRRRIQERQQQLDDLQTALVRGARRGFRDHGQAVEQLRQRLARLKPPLLLTQQRRGVGELARRLMVPARRSIELRRASVSELETRLRLLAPENVLARGYSITSDSATGKILRNSAEAKPGQRLKTRVKTGEIRSVVED